MLLQGRRRRPGDVLTRLHSQCLTGDAFGSSRCDCGGQLEDAMRSIAEVGAASSSTSPRRDGASAC